MRHGRGSSDSYKKRIGPLEHRPSRLSWVSENTQLVTRHVLNILPCQDNKASAESVQRTLSTTLKRVEGKRHVQLVASHILNTLPSEDNKASTDGVQRTLSTFDVLLCEIELVSGLTKYQIK
jgi:hypothetical protein